MEIPEAFIKWWTEFSSSNVDLAHLANVNRKWRRIVIKVLLEQAEKPQNDKTLLLLLPSMIRGILANETSITQHDNDTFCAAWFHPKGIQIQQLQLMGDVWEHERDQMFAPSGIPHYAGSDEELTGRFGVRTTSSGRTLVRQEGPLCSHEWQGYRDPMNVLEPFGYAAHFVEVSNIIVVFIH